MPRSESTTDLTRRASLTLPAGWTAPGAEPAAAADGCGGYREWRDRTLATVAEGLGLPAALVGARRYETADFAALEIQAAAPAGAAAGGGQQITMTTAAAVEIAAAAAPAEAGGRPKPRRFNMAAYNGGPMRLAGFYLPVVVDLTGVQGTERSRPILKNHNPELLVGHTDDITVTATGGIKAAGVVSGASRAAREVLDAHDDGFPWQASIGARVLNLETVKEGSSVTVNGRTFNGPIHVARKTVLGEISFVPLGADDTTSAQIAAGAAAKGTTMNFEQWLEAKGFALAGLSDAQKATLQAAFDAEQTLAAAANAGGTAGGAGANGNGGTAGTPANAGGNGQPAADAVAQIRAAAAAEVTRLGAVRQACGGRHGAIEARAISEGWDVTRTELEVLRAERPQAPGVGGNGGGRGGNGNGALDGQVITAALCLTAGIAERAVADQVPTADRERVMNAAAAGDMRGYSLHTLMDAIIHASGQHYAGSRKSNGFIRAALSAERSLAASGFSSLSLSGVLSNVANKGLIASYTAVEVVWPFICGVRNHSDFKVHTRYRLDSTGSFKKVAADGELKHVGLSDASYTNQLATFGAIIALTRQMMINDDLGAFMEIPNLLGRMAALRLEEAVFVLLLSNPSSFFHASNRNLATGGGSALSIDALTTAEQKFRDQVDGNGKPVLVSPTRLLVGSPLKVTADNLFAEKMLITGENATKPARNPHAAKYQPYTSPYVSNTNITDQDGAAISGQSSTKWWMFADPAVRAAIAVAFLNGQRTPTIESAETSFDTLGMQWRAYHDFGVGMEEPNAAVQSNGV